MHDTQQTSAAQPTLADAARAAGFRRIELVRLTVRGGRTTAQATGVVHRYPHTVAISLVTAQRLIAAGAPLRIDHHGPSQVQ